MSPPTLSEFPEELLDRILALTLAPAPASPRPSWHPPSPHRAVRSRAAPLLVSRRLARIGTPHLYHAVRLAPAAAPLLLARLRASPGLAAHVRLLDLPAVSAEAGEIMALCGAVTALAFTMEGLEGGEECRFVEGLLALRMVRHLTVRKPSTVYLSQPRPRFVIAGIAKAIEGWSHLETANLAFKLSDDTPTSPSTQTTAVFPTPSTHTLSFSSLSSPAPSYPATTHGPVTALTTALSGAPNLHTFTTHLPSVWNVAILTVSANPRLDRIALVDPRSGYQPGSPLTSPVPRQAAWSPLTAHKGLAIDTNVDGGPDCDSPCAHAATPTALSPSLAGVGDDEYQPSIIGTGLFLMEARKHARLSELIKRGTVVVRSRAFTVGV